MARERLFSQQRKTRFDDNRKNEEVYRCSECFISGRHEATLGQENRPEREYKRKDFDTGEFYQVVEAQYENKTEERRFGTDLLTEFVQGVLKTFCVIVSVTFEVLQVFVDLHGDCPINCFINPENT
jgi:hypothetical protein